MSEIVAIANGLQSAIEALREDTKKALSCVSEVQRDPRVPILQEETEILWWLFAERSADLDKALDELDRETVSIVIGKELADRTYLELPAPAIDAIVARALARVGGEEPAGGASLRSVVGGAPRVWRRMWADMSAETANEAGALTPVSLAILKSLEGGETTDWVGLYNHTSATDADARLAQSQWARQVYNECLLLRLFKETAVSD